MSEQSRQDNVEVLLALKQNLFGQWISFATQFRNVMQAIAALDQRVDIAINEFTTLRRETRELKERPSARTE